jgi:hypothetical protein
MESLRKLWEILQESNIKSTLIKAARNAMYLQYFSRCMYLRLYSYGNGNAIEWVKEQCLYTLQFAATRR